MRGAINILHPAMPNEFRIVGRAPNPAQIEQILGGLPDVIPHWNQWVNEYNILVPAIVAGNGDYRDPIQPFNLMATACWHYIARSKGVNLHSHITGPVVIFTGDDDFMSSVFTS